MLWRKHIKQKKENKVEEIRLKHCHQSPPIGGNSYYQLQPIGGNNENLKIKFNIVNNDLEKFGKWEKLN